jgi:NADH dehydrogenase FAD-containing subunit
MTAAFEETSSRQTASPLEPASRKQKRVVIIGGGFGGIAAAHALRHSDAEVVLIDRRNHHIFQPLLYQVATSGFLTWLVWAFVHILSLPQLQNWLRVQHQGLWSYFTGQRSSRLIPEPPRSQ